MTTDNSIQLFVEALAALKGQEALHSFLTEILTPKELEEIAHRHQILHLLNAGWTQREISAKLGVGIATVSRGARELKKREAS